MLWWWLVLPSSVIVGVPTFLLDGWPLGGIQEEFTMRSLLQRFVRKRQRQTES